MKTAEELREMYARSEAVQQRRAKESEQEQHHARYVKGRVEEVYQTLLQKAPAAAQEGKVFIYEDAGTEEIRGRVLDRLMGEGYFVEAYDGVDMCDGRTYEVRLRFDGK